MLEPTVYRQRIMCFIENGFRFGSDNRMMAYGSLEDDDILWLSLRHIGVSPLGYMRYIIYKR